MIQAGGYYATTRGGDGDDTITARGAVDFVEGSYTDLTLRFGYAEDPSFTQLMTVRVFGTGALSEGDFVLVNTALSAVA